MKTSWYYAMEKKKAKKKKWIHFRHRVIRDIAAVLLWPIFKIKTRFTYKRFKHKEPYLVLYNHQSVYDQFLLGYCLGPKSYFVASDDLTLIKFWSPILKWAVNIIPYKKGSTDFNILRICRQVASEGGSILISPEGNRTYCGETGYINPTISKMAKFLQMPIAFVHITGGFGVHPRFADKPRKGGKIHTEVVKTLTYDEYKDLSNEELFAIIKDNLYLDESVPNCEYRSKHLAEYLERCIYWCPVCGMTHFESHGDVLKCTKCGREVKYLPNKQFEQNDNQLELHNVKEWYRYQEQMIKDLDLSKFGDDDAIISDIVSLYLVIPRKKKEVVLENAKLTLYKDRFEFDDGKKHLIYLFTDILSIGIFGKNKMNFFLREQTYQIKADVRFNPVKYMHLYYKTRIEKGEIKDEFLGL